jgi:hypothetical protein
MFERMAEAEQEQQQRALGPGAERRRAGGRHQHQRVDLEAFQPEIVDRLAQRVEAAEQIGGHVERKRQPGRRARHQLLDCESDPQGRAAGERKDQFGIGPEQTAMRVIVTVVGAMLPLRLRRAIDMAGMSICRRRHRSGRCAELRQFSADVVSGELIAIIFDAHHAGGRGVRFDHTGQGAKAFGDRARAACVTDAIDLPKDMPVAVRDFRSRGMGEFADACERHHLRVEMDAQRRRAGGVGRDHMRLLDTGPVLKRRDEPADAGIGRIGDVGEKYGDFEAELFDHDVVPSRGALLW